MLLAGCQQQISYPSPAISKLDPDTMPAGSPSFPMTVTGSNLTPTSNVNFNGVALPLFQFQSTSSVTVQVPAALVQNPGKVPVAVVTPSPGGGVSQPLTFTIVAGPSPVPQITSLSPSGVFTGDGQFTVTITGNNFVSQSAVNVNGSARQTAYRNSTSLQAIVLASDVANAGTLQIVVVNPPPGGGTSNAFLLNVRNPVPILASLSPAAMLAGSSATQLTLAGSGFVPNSVVKINGTPRTTTFGTGGQIQASLTAADFAAAGVDQVQVVNPAPGGGSSNTLMFAVNPTDVAGLPVLVDLAPDGTQANNAICGAAPCPPGVTPTLATAGPSVSQTGQLVAFASISTNLVTTPANNGLSEIFVRDTCLSSTGASGGASSCVPRNFLVSLAPTGMAADAPSAEPSLDGSGAHVAYTSTASNLVNSVPVPAGGPRQVYWQPTCVTTGGTTTSCTGTATGAAALVSVSADGQSPGNAESYNPVISPDGQYVAFVSLATNLLSPAISPVTPQVYIRNTCNVASPTGGTCTPKTYLVSTPDGTTPGDGPSSHPAIANQGLFVSFSSLATNLGTTAPNPSGLQEIFVRATCVTTIETTGTTCTPVTNLVSTPDAAAPSASTTPADGASITPSISTDGRFIAFASTATNLVTGAGPTQQIYARDTCTGVASSTTCTPATHLVSTADGATPANAPAENPSVNPQCAGAGAASTTCATGQFIAFATRASNLGANVQNGVENVFSRNTCQGLASTATCTPNTFLASQPAGAAPPPADGDSIVPALSGNGRIVSFISSATNLVTRDNNGLADIFLAGAVASYQLTLTLQGSASGSVADGLGKVSCTLTTGTQSGTCAASYLSGTSVTLTATAASGATFKGWGGDVTATQCPATATTCTLTMAADTTVTASFQ